MSSNSRSALAPHHAEIKSQILRLLNPSSPDDLRRFLDEISVQQEVLETIYDLWPDLPHAYDDEREELVEERKECYLLYDAALDDREKARRRWDRLMRKSRWGRGEVEELKKCREYMARNCVRMVGLSIDFAEFTSQLQGYLPIEDTLRNKLEKIYVNEAASTNSKIRKMRKALAAYSEARPRAERYLYRRRSLSPDEEEDFYYYTKPELSRGSHVSTPSKQRSRPDRHESKRRRERSREWEEPPDTDIIYEVVDDSLLDDSRAPHQVYMTESPHHPFRSSSHDTSFLWRSTRALKREDDDHGFYHHRSAHFNGKRFSLSYSNLPVPTLNLTTPEKRHRSGSKYHRSARYDIEEEDDRLARRDRGISSRYLEVPKSQKQYTDWEVTEIA